MLTEEKMKFATEYTNITNDDDGLTNYLSNLLYFINNKNCFYGPEVIQAIEKDLEDNIDALMEDYKIVDVWHTPQPYKTREVVDNDD